MKFIDGEIVEVEKGKYDIYETLPSLTFVIRKNKHGRIVTYLGDGVYAVILTEGTSQSTLVVKKDNINKVNFGRRGQK